MRTRLAVILMYEAMGFILNDFVSKFSFYKRG